MERLPSKRQLLGHRNAAMNLDRKTEIFSKALDLFVENGYDGTSMSMIAGALGISKANLYYYCSSKENLLYQIHLSYLQKHFIPILDEAEKISKPKDRIVFILRKFTRLCTSSKYSQTLVQLLRSLTKDHQNEIISIWRRGYKIFRETIVELQRSNSVVKLRESFVSFLAFGMAFWTIYWWDYDRQSNADEVADTVVRIFSKGVFQKE